MGKETAPFETARFDMNRHRESSFPRHGLGAAGNPGGDLLRRTLCRSPARPAPPVRTGGDMTSKALRRTHMPRAIAGGE